MLRSLAASHAVRAAICAGFILSAYSVRGQAAPDGRIDPSVIDALGLGASVVPAKAPGGPPPQPNAGIPRLIPNDAAFSAAIMTSYGQRGGPLQQVSLLGDWDGREDLNADHTGKVEDFSEEFGPPQQFTRAAASAHTIANGFTENVFYYADSIGNVWVGVDAIPNSVAEPLAETFHKLNIPTTLNAFGTVLSDDEIVITGLAVCPVADHSAFARVNGAFAPDFDGKIGEILYVSYWDTGGGLRLAGSGTLVRSGLLAFPILDTPSPAAAPPAVQSDIPFPVTVGGSFGVVFSVFSNIGGIAVDDDGSIYFHQADLIGFAGGNIVKITSFDRPGSNGWQDRSLAVSGILTITSLNPAGGNYGNSSGPASQINRATNFSGTSPLWGNIVSIACGPHNKVYAAVSRSLNSEDDAATQAASGLFPAAAATGATPSMIVAFSDTTGAFDLSTIPSPGLEVRDRFPAGDGATDMVFGAFGDGMVADLIQDAAVCDRNSGAVTVLQGAANGELGTPAAYAVGTSPAALVTGFFDAGSIIDLAVANSGSDNVSILLGNADGTFQPAVNYAVGTAPVALAAAFIDGNPNADLAVVNSGSGNVTVLLGAGDGTFAAGINTAVGAGPTDVVTGIFDANAQLDLAVTNGADDSVSILLGVGDGTFAAGTGLAAGDNPRAVVAGEFSGGDFNTDLAIVNRDSADLFVFEGNGDGTFDAPSGANVEAGPVALLASDFNTDGLVDFAVSCETNDAINILLKLPAPLTGYVGGRIPGVDNAAGLAVPPAAVGVLAAASPADDEIVAFRRIATGAIPVGDNIADVAVPGAATQPGVNNFRVFAMGEGPDLRGAVPEVFGYTTDTLKLSFQIDFTIFSGLAVDEEDQAYVISGGTPAGLGRNPSPNFGEILAFTDRAPADFRADFVDFRGDVLPNPPNTGFGAGDGDSDRFDHIFAQAPVDQITFAPGGISGLAAGHLLYLNRTRNDATKFLTLPNGATQGDDDTNGPIAFDEFDPSLQVSGGDLFTFPTAGDGDGLSDLGFEFGFGGVVGGVCTDPWSEFYLNSNGNVTFNAGDPSLAGTLTAFRSGSPRAAPAWTDFLCSSRSFFPNTFPVQALGFSGVNAFKVRWINAPKFASALTGSNNTFSVTLYDDGTGADEDQPGAIEGPPALRYGIDPATEVAIGSYPRIDGSSNIRFDYGRNDMTAVDSEEILVGYGIGDQATVDPPAICQTNLSEASRASENDPFRRYLLGLGVEPQIFERFEGGTAATHDATGIHVPVIPAFDLRPEGFDPTLATPAGQPDLNRAWAALYGVACDPPPAGDTFSVAFNGVVGPDQPEFLVNVLHSAEVTLLGTRFFPNVETTVCSGEGTERAGYSTSTIATIGLDEDNDTIAEETLNLTGLTPAGQNAIRGTLLPHPSASGSPFPIDFSEGRFIYTVTTSFTAGDNNVFGAFDATSVVSFTAFRRTPIVTGVSLTSADPNGHMQTLEIAGEGFEFLNGDDAVADVLAIEAGNPENVVRSASASVVDSQKVMADFSFGSANAGKSFFIHVSDPTHGLSRNLSELPDGAPIACPLGNELGVQVIFGCGATCENHAGHAWKLYR